MRTPLTATMLILLLSGCAGAPVCDIDDPQHGKDCFDCTRKAKLLARDTDPYTKKTLTVEELTEQCLRERGYVKQKDATGAATSP